MLSTFREHDVVRVVRLVRADRSWDGSEGIKRPPRVADLGTVVHAWPPDEPEHFSVECVDDEGYTIWLADFVLEEIELVWRAP